MGVRLAQHLAGAPMESGFGVEATTVTDERIELRAPLSRDAAGRTEPVLLTLLADSGVGYAVHHAARLDAGAPTLDLRIDHVDPPAPDAREVRAAIELLHLDDEVGLGRAELRDDRGTLLAHAVATMAMTAVPAVPGGLGRVPPAGTGSGERDFRDGLPPFDPARLDPAALPSVHGGALAFTPGPSATNLNGVTYGAVLAVLAQAAQTRFLAGRGTGVRVLSQTVDYLRPAPIDVELRAHTEDVRAGRRFWTLRTELRDPEGRVVVRAVGNGTWAARGTDGAVPTRRVC